MVLTNKIYIEITTVYVYTSFSNKLNTDYEIENYNNVLIRRLHGDSKEFENNYKSILVDEINLRKLPWC